METKPVYAYSLQSLYKQGNRKTCLRVMSTNMSRMDYFQHVPDITLKVVSETEPKQKLTMRFIKRKLSNGADKQNHLKIEIVAPC